MKRKFTVRYPERTRCKRGGVVKLTVEGEVRCVGVTFLGAIAAEPEALANDVSGPLDPGIFPDNAGWPCANISTSSGQHTLRSWSSMIGFTCTRNVAMRCRVQLATSVAVLAEISHRSPRK